MDTNTKKHVLITGAYGGMGKAAVNAFVAAGYHVFALDKTVFKTYDKRRNVFSWNFQSNLTDEWEERK